MASYQNFDRQYRLAAGQAGSTGFEIGETSKAQPVPLLRQSGGGGFLRCAVPLDLFFRTFV